MSIKAGASPSDIDIITWERSSRIHQKPCNRTMLKKKPLTDCRNQLYILKTSSITSIMVDFYTEMRAKTHM